MLAVTNDGANPTTALDVSWNPSSGATTYNLLGASTLAGPFTLLASGISGTSTTVTGLTPGTEYAFQVEAIGSGGTSSPSSGVAWATAPPAPTSRSWQQRPGHLDDRRFYGPQRRQHHCDRRVRLSIRDSGRRGQLGRGLCGGAGIPFTISGLAAGTQYGIEIATVIQSTNSDFAGSIQGPWSSEIAPYTAGSQYGPAQPIARIVW